MKIGTFVLFKIGTKVLVGQNALSFDNTTKMIETSSKLSGNDSEYVAGRKSKTMNVAGIAGTSKEATDAGYWELYAAQEAGVPVEVTFTEYTDETGTTPATGSEMLTAQALISKLNGSWPDNAENTFTCDVQVTGKPTQSTNP